MFIDNIIRELCPKEEIEACSEAIIDYTFRLKDGAIDSYVLVSIGSWAGKRRVREFKQMSLALKTINSAAARVRQYFDGIGRPEVRIACYYNRGGEGGARVCENWPE